MKAREIQKNVTRPTSVVGMALLFELIQLIWPGIVTSEIQQWIYKALTFLAGTGLLDKAWRNRKKIIEWVKRLFKRKNETP